MKSNSFIDTSIWELYFNQEFISTWSESYCRTINDLPELRKQITNYIDALVYYLTLGDDPIIRKNVDLKKAAEWYVEETGLDDHQDEIKELLEGK